MDESLQDATRAPAGMPWRVGEPGAVSRPGGARGDTRSDLRFSDAERGGVVTRAAGLSGGMGGWVLWPLWLLLPITVLRLGWWGRGLRRRRWR